MRDASPEERLLRLIKEKRKSAATPEETKAPGKAVIPKEKKPWPFKMAHLYITGGILLALLSAIFISGIFSGKENKELADMKVLISSVNEEKGDIRSEKAKAIHTEKPAQESAKRTPETSFQEYQEVLKEKAIFAPGPAGRQDTSVYGGGNLEGLIKDLRLVGIVPGDEPQAIIEDKGTQQTLFLKKGERIKNIEVREISVGRVILGYGDETITLSL